MHESSYPSRSMHESSYPSRSMHESSYPSRSMHESSYSSHTVGRSFPPQYRGAGDAACPCPSDQKAPARAAMVAAASASFAGVTRPPTPGPPYASTLLGRIASDGSPIDFMC